MKRFKAKFFLVLILWVQFGSTGFTFYVNSCSTSGITSVTWDARGCRCNPEVLECNDETQKNEHVEKRCCLSIEHFAQTAEDFPASTLQGHTINSIVEFYVIPRIVHDLNSIQNIENGGYLHDSPPEKNIDTRIFIQSLQI